MAAAVQTDTLVQTMALTVVLVEAAAQATVVRREVAQHKGKVLAKQDQETLAVLDGNLLSHLILVAGVVVLRVLDKMAVIQMVLVALVVRQ